VTVDPPAASRQFADSDTHFDGFPNSGAAVTIPSLFFSAVLPKIDGVEELVVSAYCFFALSNVDRSRQPRYVTRRELESDRTLMRTLAKLGGGDDGDALRAGLAAAVARGTLARAAVDVAAGEDEVFVVNTPANRKALQALEGKRLEIEPPLPAIETGPVSNAFTLYEENIGSITPLIAEDLKEAEEQYPLELIRDAIKEAVLANKRSWRYVHTILSRWETEGPDHEESERDPQIEWLERRYAAGQREDRTARS
jgi:DnaD/phage-associated family protein